jgi:hypothetical protein
MISTQLTQTSFSCLVLTAHSSVILSIMHTFWCALWDMGLLLSGWKVCFETFAFFKQARRKENYLSHTKPVLGSFFLFCYNSRAVTNLNEKCWNSASNARGGLRVIIVVIQVWVVKIYEAAVEMQLRKNERRVKTKSSAIERASPPARPPASFSRVLEICVANRPRFYVSRSMKLLEVALIIDPPARTVRKSRLSSSTWCGESLVNNQQADDVLLGAVLEVARWHNWACCN